MNIKNVKIKNFKGIKIIDISTEKNMIFISGPNGAGKSSFCDAIMTTLSGNDKAIKRPIREGESMASVVIELDGYKVTQVIRQGKPRTITVQPLDSSTPMQGPQAWLNEHIGILKFDPGHFVTMKDTEQRNIITKLAGLNLEDEDKKIEEIYNDRLFIGREIDNMSKPSEEEVDEAKKADVGGEISVSELSEAYTKESSVRTTYLGDQQEIKNNLIKIEELKGSIKGFEERNEALSQTKDTTENLEELKAKIDNAEELNTKIRASKVILEANDKHLTKQKEQEDKTEELSVARDTKKQLIQAATYPIEGLSVDDTGVTYNGIPFSQVNDSQKLTIGSLIALSLMPKNDPIKLILIKNASLFDDKALDYLQKTAIKEGAQFVLEFIHNDKGFVMEEGEVIT